MVSAASPASSRGWGSRDPPPGAGLRAAPPRTCGPPVRPTEGLARQLCGQPAPRSPRRLPRLRVRHPARRLQGAPAGRRVAPRLPGGAPASPRRHHHIVDDQVRRGHGPGALLLPHAAAVASPGSAAAAPIPLGRCSRHRCRHVKRPQPALLLARAPQTRLSTARGRRKGRGRGGAAARGGAGTAPTGAAILDEGKGSSGAPA